MMRLLAFGLSILVAPVIRKENRREIYLPKGDWYDYWSGKAYEGPVTIPADEEIPLDHLPVYVKAGAVIPMDVEVGRGTPAPHVTRIGLRGGVAQGVDRRRLLRLQLGEGRDEPARVVDLALSRLADGEHERHRGEEGEGRAHGRG